ncbi:CRISPR-associated endonuclease Cas2 [Streptococcus suis]|nr:CRISPR-associated endonuclease Cas2 [Streptococcus suis]
MFVILVYDVNVKRTAKVLKTVRPYLSHLQRSVFEGETEDSYHFTRSASPI